MKGTHPYSDDFMIFDERTGRYVITELALEDEGIYLRARLERYPHINAASVLSGLFRTATKQVYNYLHKYSNDNKRQDAAIAHTPSMRSIIYDALVEQTKFIYMVGDFTLSPDPQKRENPLSPAVADILGTVVPEWGHSVLYSGGW